MRGVEDLVFSGAGELALWYVILILAQLVYVTFGFGAGLIALGGLSLAGAELRDVVVILLLVNLPVEAALVVASRRVIRWRSVALVCAGTAVGIPLGTFLLRHGEPTFLLAALGVLLVLAGAEFLVRPTRPSIRWPAWAAAGAGSLAGLLGGLFGTAGPPVILYYRLAGIPKAAFRGSLVTIFAAITLGRLPAYAVAGLFTTTRLWSALALAPAILLGGLLGQRIHLGVSERRFQTLVSLALMLIGALLLSRFALARGLLG